MYFLLGAEIYVSRAAFWVLDLPTLNHMAQATGNCAIFPHIDLSISYVLDTDQVPRLEMKS